MNIILFYTWLICNFVGKLYDTCSKDLDSLYELLCPSIFGKGHYGCRREQSASVSCRCLGMFYPGILFFMFHVLSYLNFKNIQKVDAIEEAFNDFLIQRKDEGTKYNTLEKELISLMNENQGESQETVLLQLIAVISGVSSDSHSKLVFKLLENVVNTNIATSR